MDDLFDRLQDTDEEFKEEGLMMCKAMKDLKSQAWICGCDVVQEFVRVLADERFLVIASCEGRGS